MLEKVEEFLGKTKKSLGIVDFSVEMWYDVCSGKEKALGV